MLRRKRFDILRKRPIRFTQKAINHSSVQRRQQVWDDIRLTERLAVTLSASFADSLTLQDFVVAILPERTETVSDSVNLSDIVSYEVQDVSGYMIIPDGYAIYDYNFNIVQGNLTVWWDGDTSTSFTIYFSPSAPNNPHYAILFFVDYPPTITRFKIFVPSCTTGKSLVIEVFDFAGYPIYTTTIPLTAGQWITVEPDAPLMDVGQIAVYTDSNIVGFVEIAEFQLYTGGSGN